MLPSNARPLARLVLLSLTLTFVLARLVSILIALHRMPNIFFHVHDTHVHHLNYGIFLLAGVGAYLLFSSGPAGPAAAVVYGIGIALAWLYFLVWKLRYSAAIREDAVQRSLAVTAGKVHEQLVPYLPEFGFNPKDARFL